MNIKKGDNVIILTGKDRGKQGKVLRALPSLDKVVVEGVNIKHRRRRPRRQGEKGQVIDMPVPVQASNVGVFCSSCNKAARIGFNVEKGKKTRVCRKCGKEL